ncbi:MAG: hypothetical protein JSS86_04915 [Cyanobacteria bacterium SZAS LIN-2]|nr:hypothetical protein [Cyanobacteria bacterium SZAS LIN-2]MBS2008381.1 hypothetical protein [Cyanobacteria bacterium SZAS TMP-1]
MTFAGKTLQDIYNSGSNQLNELEESSTAKLANKSSSHLSERRESEQQSKMEVAAKAAAVDEEIKRQAREAGERIRVALEKEKATSQAYIDDLCLKLSSFNSDIKKAIGELRTSYESTLDDAYLRASDHYSSAAEGSVSELQTQHYQSGQRLRSQSSFFANTLQQKLDHSLWESRGSEKQSNSALFRNYMQKANNIESHFSTLMQRLNNDFKIEFEKLESYARAGQEDFANDSDSFSKSIDEILTNIEQDINEIFAACIENNKQSLTEKFHGTIEQVQDLGSETGKQLREDTNEIVSNLKVASREGEKNLKKKCDEVTERMQLDMQAFVGRINSKVNESDLVRRQLSEAKSKVINEIRDELIAIRNAFETRLNELTKESKENLTAIANEVDSDMKGAYDQSLFKITSDSTSARGEIEEATRKLLEMISEQKNNALREIARAAGEET